MHCAFNIEEVPVVGAKAAGVKAINLRERRCRGSLYRLAFTFDSAGSLKRMAVSDILITSRGKSRFFKFAEKGT